ncbi:MAG: hypothetical protein AB1458_14145 [Bacteroidota bacterium]
MKRIAVMLLVSVLSVSLWAQKDTLNVTDKSGKKQGRWIKKHPNGKVFYEGQFKDDIPYGRFKYYYQSGELQTIVVFSDKGQTRRAKMYHKNGKLMAEGKYTGEKRDSVWRFYNDMGYYISSEPYKDGKKEGVAYTYFSDSSGVWGVAELITYKNDVKNGLWQQFYPDSSKKTSANYLNGLMDGKATYYYPGNKTSAEGSFKKGLKDGLWKYYNEDGTPESQELWKEGVYVKGTRENGIFEDYYPKNILKSVTTYKNGKKNGSFKEYYETGEYVITEVKNDDGTVDKVENFVGQKIKRSGTYKDDKLDGKIVYYKMDGTIEKTEHYKDGVLIKTE